MSITRFNYLFCLTIQGRCIQHLALEIWGEEVCFGRRVVACRFETMGHVTVFVCEIPC